MKFAGFAVPWGLSVKRDFVIIDPTTKERQRFAFSMLHYSIQFAHDAIASCAQKMIDGTPQPTATHSFSSWADGVIYWKNILDQLERVRDAK